MTESRWEKNPYLAALEILDDQVLTEQLSEARGKLSDRFELTVGGRPWTDYARNVAFDNSGDDGGATLTFDSKKSMDEMGDARVTLRVDGKLYFTGTLKRPAQADGSPFVQSAVALGPFAAMASQFFGEQVSYTGDYLSTALYDIATRAYRISGMAEVVGGESLTIEEADFTEETSLQEGAQAVCGPANFVMFDTAIGGRRFMRTPRPGAAGGAIRSYTADDYADGAFTIEQKYDGAFSKVVVFRRNEAGGYDVREEFPVDQVGDYRAAKNRIYYISDFPGNAAQAKEEAYEIARSMVDGEVDFSLSVPWREEDSKVTRYDRIACERYIERSLPRPGLYRELYGLVADGGVAGDCSAEILTFTGSGILRRRERIEASLAIRRIPESLLLSSPYLAPSVLPLRASSTYTIGEVGDRRVGGGD